MKEKELTGLVIDRILAQLGWKRDFTATITPGAVSMRDDTNRPVVWPDPHAFLFGRGGYMSVFKCLGMRQYDLAGSCEELEMMLRIGGLL